MNHLRCGIFTVGLTVIIVNTGLAQTTWHTDLNAARREAERLNRPILCHFGAKWCAPCQKMEKTVLNQSAVARELKTNVVGLKVDCEERPELAHRFEVEEFPTDVFLEPNGQRLFSSTGYHSVDEYVALIDRASRRYSDLVAARQSKSQPALANSPESGSSSSQLAKTATPHLMLEGYCPVTLQQSRKWVKGDVEYHAEHKGQIYQFADAQAREKFLKTPDRYAPQLLGCDPVVIWNTDRAISGSIEFGAYYDERLYLFTSRENRRKFKEAPDKFISTRVVIRVDQIESAIR